MLAASASQPASRDKWVPLTTAWRVLRLRIEERPQIRRVAANILNSSRGQPTRVGPPAWGWARC
jgi:hypothetical protein